MIPRNAPHTGIVLRKNRVLQDGIETWSTNEVGTVLGLFTLGATGDLAERAQEVGRRGAVADSSASFRVTSGVEAQVDDQLRVGGEIWRVVAKRAGRLLLR